MIISQDVIIDTILNVAGFLAAGGLALMMSSIFRRSSKEPSWAGGVNRQSSGAQLNKPINVPERMQRIEFVKLDHSQDRSASSRAVTSDIPHRNRVEIIRLARQMVEAGAHAERVKAVLPISDAELALLTSHTK
ncbi:MAG: hypothetical protein ACE5K8_01205 [Candidatus Zixiibacteriota bacterium]